MVANEPGEERMKPAGFFFLGSMILIAPHMSESLAKGWALVFMICGLIAWSVE